MIINSQSQTPYNSILTDESTVSDTRESNVVQADLLIDSFSKVKTSNKTVLHEGDIAQQSITLTNNSSITISNISVRDVLSSGAEYVPNSVIVDGTSQPTYDLATGFNLGRDIAPGQSVIVSYQIRAMNPMTQTPVTNNAVISYTAEESQYEENTNTISIDIEPNNLTIVKSVDKTVAIKGDTLHYTSIINNASSTEKTNMTFTDDIPNGTIFVTGSVLINSATYPNYNPQTGFAIPDLPAGGTNTIEFDVTVNNMIAIINNTSKVTQEGETPIQYNSNTVQTVIQNSPQPTITDYTCYYDHCNDCFFRLDKGEYFYT